MFVKKNVELNMWLETYASVANRVLEEKNTVQYVEAVGIEK